MVRKSQKTMLWAQKRSFGYILIMAFLTMTCFLMLYPFINLLFQSFAKASEIIAAKGMMLYPKTIQLDAYQFLFRYPYLAQSYRNTIFITLVGTTLAMIITSIGAYVLSRRDLPGRKYLTTFIVLTMFFSGGMIPTYLNMRNLSLTNTLWVLIFPFMISTWNMLLMRNFFMAIPIELSEAARIDGTSEIRLFVSIILPLSMPILATIALFYGVGRWNEYSNVIIYNSKNDMQTLQVIIRRMYEQSRLDDVALEGTIMPPLEAIRAATVIFSTVPILCVYPFLQKYFAQGLMVGSVKG
jgi:putative aldouronate transport system permease protein